MYFFTNYGKENSFEHYKMLYNINEHTFKTLYSDVEIIVPKKRCVVPIDKIFKTKNITHRNIEKYIGCEMEVFNPIKNINEIKILSAAIIEYDKGRESMYIDGVKFGKIDPTTSSKLFFVDSLDDSIERLNFKFYEIYTHNSFEVDGEINVRFSNNIINNSNIETIEDMNYIHPPRFKILHTRESRWAGTPDRVTTIQGFKKMSQSKNKSNKKNKKNKKNKSKKNKL